jgi:hypothetical protein
MVTGAESGSWQIFARALPRVQSQALQGRSARRSVGSDHRAQGFQRCLTAPRHLSFSSNRSSYVTYFPYSLSLRSDTWPRRHGGHRTGTAANSPMIALLPFLDWHTPSSTSFLPYEEPSSTSFTVIPPLPRTHAEATGTGLWELARRQSSAPSSSENVPPAGQGAQTRTILLGCPTPTVNDAAINDSSSCVIASHKTSCAGGLIADLELGSIDFVRSGRDWTKSADGAGSGGVADRTRWRPGREAQTTPKG